MPVRPREINDQPTEARLRQIIRQLLDQEVRRLSLTATTNSTTVTTMGFVTVQEWAGSLPGHPVEVTLWSKQSVASVSGFDTFEFDTVQFDEAGSTEIQTLNTTAVVTFIPSTGVFTIDWGSTKTGTIYTISYGADARAIVAVAD